MPFDITPIAQQWEDVGMDPNYGVMLEVEPTDTISGDPPTFYSDEGCGGECPYLEIECMQSA